MIPSLSTVQQALQEFILGQQSGQTMAPLIAQRPGLAVDDRLSIYHNAYRVRLREALSESHDKTHAYLGDDLFEQVASQYIAAQPSFTPNLRWYGARFSAMLAQSFPDHPVLAELAEFEWTLGLAFDAADQRELVLTDLASISQEAWENTGFACQDSVHFLSLHSNCVAIWLALGEEQTPPEALWQETPQHWLVWRKHLQTHFRSLSSAELQALRALQAGQSFAAVCVAIAEQHPDATSRIGQWLGSWAGDGVLQALPEAASRS